MKKKGIVYLVGAGPGDAGLMTLRGAELLGRADVVVYDALVNGDLLQLAGPAATLLYAGKRAGQHALPQDELNRLLVAEAKAGKCVVRLKGGDPYVFGRGGEEAEELVAAGISFEVVPGISSTIAGPNYAGIPVTHRDFCSSFTVITGHEDPEKETTEIDWAGLAKTPGTKIVLMGMSRLAQIAQSLVNNGMESTTPVAVIQWATTGRQKKVFGTLQNIFAVAEEAGMAAPALIVIGQVVSLHKKLDWFGRKPLAGRSIVVTRTRVQASQLSRQLRERGAEVLEIPVIRTDAPTEKAPIAEVLLELNSYDWIIFTSPNGVTAFFEFFFRVFKDLRDIGGVRIAAVGAATAAKIKELHLNVDLTPDEYVTAKIADALAKDGSVENLKILLLRAEVANQELPQKLEEMGAIVDDVACYRTVPETEDRNGAAARFLENGADWLTFTSSSTVENFNSRFDLKEVMKRFPKTRIASIGPETTRALSQLEIIPAVEAREHTIDGLVRAVETA